MAAKFYSTALQLLNFTQLRSATNFYSTALQGEQSNVKILVMSRYKFGLAIENTRDPDYITEKLFEVKCCAVLSLFHLLLFQ